MLYTVACEFKRNITFAMRIVTYIFLFHLGERSNMQITTILILAKRQMFVEMLTDVLFCILKPKLS